MRLDEMRSSDNVEDVTGGQPSGGGDPLQRFDEQVEDPLARCRLTDRVRREHQPVDRGVVAGELHVLLPPGAQVRHRVVGDGLRDLVAHGPVEPAVDDRREQALLVAEQAVEHRLADAGGVAHGARGDVMVRGGGQLRFGRREQPLAEVVVARRWGVPNQHVAMIARAASADT